MTGTLHPGCNYFAINFCNKCGWLKSTSQAQQDAEQIAALKEQIKERDALIEKQRRNLTERTVERDDWKSRWNSLKVWEDLETNCAQIRDQLRLQLSAAKAQVEMLKGACLNARGKILTGIPYGPHLGPIVNESCDFLSAALAQLKSEEGGKDGA